MLNFTHELTYIVSLSLCLLSQSLSDPLLLILFSFLLGFLLFTLNLSLTHHAFFAQSPLTDTIPYSSSTTRALTRSHTTFSFIHLSLTHPLLPFSHCLFLITILLSFPHTSYSPLTSHNRFSLPFYSSLRRRAYSHCPSYTILFLPHRAYSRCPLHNFISLPHIPSSLPHTTDSRCPSLTHPHISLPHTAYSCCPSHTSSLTHTPIFRTLKHPPLCFVSSFFSYTSRFLIPFSLTFILLSLPHTYFSLSQRYLTMLSQNFRYKCLLYKLARELSSLYISLIRQYIYKKKNLLQKNLRVMCTMSSPLRIRIISQY